MKKIFSILMVLLFSMVFCQTAISQNVTIDLSKLDSVTRNKIIEVNSSKTDVLTKDNLDKFKEYGLIISTTLKEVCQTLNVEVNSFIKTPVGMLTTGLIVYKVIGKDIIRGVFTILICGFLYIIILTSFIIFHAPKKIVAINSDKIKSISYMKRYPFSNGESRTVSVIAHLFCFIITTIILLERI